MAGLYAQPGPDAQNPSLALDDLFVNVPSLMNYYKASMAKSKYSFIYKYEALIETFSRDLTVSLQALEAKHLLLDSLDPYKIELTIAGYDGDGKLKLAAVLLAQRRDEGGIHYISFSLPPHDPSPECESAGARDNSSLRKLLPQDAADLPNAPRIINEAFVCEVAGIPDAVASKMLANPKSYPGIPALGVFAAKLQSVSTSPLRRCETLRLRSKRKLQRTKSEAATAVLEESHKLPY